MTNILSIGSFTNLGYLIHSRNHEKIESDLSDQTILITGASAGLGGETAMTLAGLGARVLAVARSEDKLAELHDRSAGRIVPVPGDLSLMEEVRRVTDQVIDNCGRLDVLINNVGVLLPERSETSEGIETTLATNLAGHFLLTNRLIPLMVESAPARIINVSSGGMYTERIRPDDLGFTKGKYSGAAAYARTKRAQVELTEMWANRLAGTGVVVHSMHPGWAKTGGVSAGLPIFDKVMKPLLRTASQGADTIVWLAAAEEPAQTSGRFWFDRRPVDTHLLKSTKVSEKVRRALWSRLEEITGWPEEKSG